MFYRSVMTLPREFRRLRIALIGFGDVAKRTFAQRAAYPSARHGPRFVLVSRSPLSAPPAGLRNTLRSIRGQALAVDVDQYAALRRLLRVPNASIIYVPTAEQSNQPSHRDSRGRRLAAAYRTLARRTPMVYLSTTGVYGHHHDAVVDEMARCKTTQARSRRRLDAEHQLRPLGAHVLRVPGIYGHDRLPLARLQARQPALRPEDDVYTNHIHADDLAHVAWIALFRGKPGRITNAVDQTEMKMGEYFDAVADATGLPRPPRVRRDELNALAQQGVIHPMMMSFMADSRRVTTRRLQQELGVRLRYPTVLDALNTIWCAQRYMS